MYYAINVMQTQIMQCCLYVIIYTYFYPSNCQCSMIGYLSNSCSSCFING